MNTNHNGCKAHQLRRVDILFSHDMLRFSLFVLVQILTLSITFLCYSFPSMLPNIFPSSSKRKMVRSTLANCWFITISHLHTVSNFCLVVNCLTNRLPTKSQQLFNHQLFVILIKYAPDLKSFCIYHFPTISQRYHFTTISTNCQRWTNLGSAYFAEPCDSLCLSLP